MTFRWTRAAGNVTATCDACRTTFTQRTDTDLLRAQRGHDLTTCIAQQRAARVADIETRIDRATYSLTEGGAA